MGFSDDIAMKAASKYPTSIEQAVTYAMEPETKEKAKKNGINIGECNPCHSLQRIINVLIFYQDNANNDKMENMSTYLINNKYLPHLLRDYHHILDQHLNEDTISSNKTKEDFNLIHQLITKQNGIYCAVNKCKIYKRTNREREKQGISSIMTLNNNNNNDEMDDNMSFYIDILDSLHCYFVHSVDIGYRMIRNLNDNDIDTKHDEDDDDDYNNSFDAEIVALKSYLESKRKNLKAVRGENRLRNSKFMTRIISTHNNGGDEKSDNSDANIIKEGVVFKYSRGYILTAIDLYWKQRFLMLYDNKTLSYLEMNKNNEMVKKGTICMSDISSSDIKESDKKCKSQGASYGFTIQINTERKWDFAVRSAMDRYEWIKQLRSLCTQNVNDSHHVIPTIIQTQRKRRSQTLSSLDIDSLHHEIKEKTVDEKEIQYSFGERYNYWKVGGIFKAKYDSLKKELLSNKIYYISPKVWNEAYIKAIMLQQNSDKMRSIKSIGSKIHKIEKDSVMSIFNILSIIFYTDYDILSFKFSQTFRRIKDNESDDEIMERNGEYFNWSKILIETVNCFGNEINKSLVPIFYHGISMVYFNAFIGLFNSPTSTTTQLSIATIFAKQNGIILELKQYREGWLRYFNCSFISCYSNENERLFIRPPGFLWHYYLQFASIRNILRNQNYGDWIDGITKFEQVIMGTSDHEIQLKSISIILSLIQNNTNIPEYVLKSFEKWKDNKIKIKINLKFLPSQLFQLLLCENQQNINNLLSFDKINNIFKQIKCIKCFETGIISSSAYFELMLKMLTKINKMKFSKLNKIEIHGIDDDINKFEGFRKYTTLFLKINWKIKVSNTGFLGKPALIISSS